MKRRRVPIFRPKTPAEVREFRRDIRAARAGIAAAKKARYLVLMTDAREL